MTTDVTIESSSAPGAGSYFVANYPPFSAWTPGQVDAFDRALSSPPRPGTDLGLYLHIPFCRKRCHFCYFKVYTDRTKDEISAYVDMLAQEVSQYRGQPAIAGRAPTFLYFGGGTPSYLSVRHLHQLHGVLSAAFDVTGLREFTFEGEPGTLSRTKLEAIKDIGVTRLSIGVESFGDEVLRLNGRAHDRRQIQAACTEATRVGFPQINIDLIAGMVGETEANWRASVDAAIESGPSSVTIYQMEIPHNTNLYRQVRDHTAPGGVAGWDTKRRWLGYAFAELEQAGYRVSSGYTMSRPAPGSDFVYRDSLWHGADLVGLGVSAFSHLSGVHYQNEHDFAGYMARVQAGELPVYRALAPSRQELMIREFVLQMKLGHLRRDYFQDKFSADVLDVFRAPLANLASQGLITIGDTEVILSREALLQVDGLLPAFFLPQHQNIRYS